jgi:hypothetical protein
MSANKRNVKRESKRIGKNSTNEHEGKVESKSTAHNNPSLEKSFGQSDKD